MANIFSLKCNEREESENKSTRSQYPPCIEIKQTNPYEEWDKVYLKEGMWVNTCVYHTLVFRIVLAEMSNSSIHRPTFDLIQFGIIYTLIQ